MKTSVQCQLVSLFAASSLFANAEGRSEQSVESRATPGGSSTAKPMEKGFLTNATDRTKPQLNFQNAAVDLVLDYLSAAGRLIIQKEAEARGSINVQSKGPVTADEAIQLVNAALKSVGCTLVRDGRIVTVASLD